MRKPLLALGPLVLAASIHCGGSEVNPAPAVSDAGADVTTTPPPPPGSDAAVDVDPADPPLVPSSKLDLLFVIDNSNGMGKKHQYLADAVGRMLKALPVKDLHVGVISTSLGNGGDVCANRGDNPHLDDRGHLRNEAEAGGIVAGAENGFLTLGAGGVTDIATLEAKTKEIIAGVRQTGCGLEAQLEAMYRFMVDPEPPATVSLDAFKTAQRVDIDYDLLKERKAFFRPDSAVAIVMLTDEDDGSIDPLAISGYGYAFAARDFPGSNIRRGTTAQGTTAPRGTSACLTDPLSADCTSCGFSASCDANTASCQKIKADPICKTSGAPPSSGPGYDGFFAADKDDLNVRMFDMRRRFGISPLFPVTRYSIGLTERRVPSRATEHVESKLASGQRMLADYAQSTACTNPLFASNLPEKPGDELCHLGDNGRSSRLVFFGLIGGLPPALAKAPVDFTKLVGANPPADGSVPNDEGVDPLMIASIDKRPNVVGDWNTSNKDLQYACTFTLPTPVDCTNDTACECHPSGDPLSPICDGSTQLADKAYPTFRELLLAQQLGERAVVSSSCDLDSNHSYGAFFDAFAVKVNGGLIQ